MQIKYFQTAWNDLTKSEGWLRKMMLLALISLIPIFGAIVVMGYLYGWARDIAWGVRNPLPARIFANEDGKLYRRGFFIFVIGIVVGILPYIVFTFAEGALGIGWAGLLASSVNSGGYAPYGTLSSIGSPAISAGSLTTGGLLYLLGIALSLGLCFFQWAANMRVSIYDNLSSGFQVGKLWSMLRADGGGILRIFGMTVLASIVIGFILTLVFGLLMLIFLAMFAGGFVALAQGGSSSSSVDTVISALLVGGLFFTIWMYIMLVCVTIVEALQARALGYWVGQFDVPHWGGQNDPAPFENFSRPGNPQQPQPFDGSQQAWGNPDPSGASQAATPSAPVAGQPQGMGAVVPAAAAGAAVAGVAAVSDEGQVAAPAQQPAEPAADPVQPAIKVEVDASATGPQPEAAADAAQPATAAEGPSDVSGSADSSDAGDDAPKASE